MKDLLPLSEETKDEFLKVLRKVTTELAPHNDLYSTTFRLFLEELGKMFNNSEGLNMEELVDSATLLMGIMSEHILGGEIIYELVEEDEEDVELE